MDDGVSIGIFSSFQGGLVATKVIMPAFGATQETGVLLKWFKREGEPIAKGEPLMEVETDKATVEVAATVSGVLLRRGAAEGATVPVGQTVAFIGARGEVLVEETGSVVPTTPGPGGAIPAGIKSDTGAAQSRVNLSSFLVHVWKASPAARRFARENSLEIASVKGSGPGGAVLVRDLRSVVSSGAKATVNVAGDVPFGAMRRIIGARMSASKQNAPHFYLSLDVNMTTAMEQRQKWKTEGLSLLPSINDLIILACAKALQLYPLMNSQYRNQGIERFAAIHIGFAVALDDGLVVPVVRHAGGLNLYELARQTRELVDKAHNKKLTPADYEGGTFTISNLGMFGVDSFTAIINPPQCAILAVGRVAPRVVADDEGIAIRQMMTITLSADHRVADGAIGARFLQSVKTYLEAGEWTAAMKS